MKVCQSSLPDFFFHIWEKMPAVYTLMILFVYVLIILQVTAQISPAMSVVCFQSSLSSWSAAKRKRDRWELRSHSIINVHWWAEMRCSRLVLCVWVWHLCVLVCVKERWASHLGGPRCAAESHCCSLRSKSHSKGTSLHVWPSALYPAQAKYLFKTHTHTHTHTSWTWQKIWN